MQSLRSTQMALYPRKKQIGLIFRIVKVSSTATAALSLNQPIRLILGLGISFIVVAFCVLIWTLYSYFTGHVVAGWSSLMLSIWFCSGCVLTCMGIVGEYIGKIYVECKERPRFNIETVLMD